MSRGISRLGDLCTGHGGYPPRQSIEASTDVFANKLGIVRVGDKFAIHCDHHECHDGTQSDGSSSVYVNGKKVARIDDDIDCGSKNLEGSGDVFCG